MHINMSKYANSTTTEEKQPQNLVLEKVKIVQDNNTEILFSFEYEANIEKVCTVIVENQNEAQTIHATFRKAMDHVMYLFSLKNTTMVHLLVEPAVKFRKIEHDYLKGLTK